MTGFTVGAIVAAVEALLSLAWVLARLRKKERLKALVAFRQYLSEQQAYGDQPYGYDEVVLTVDLARVRLAGTIAVTDEDMIQARELAMIALRESGNNIDTSMRRILDSSLRLTGVYLPEPPSAPYRESSE